MKTHRLLGLSFVVAAYASSAFGSLVWQSTFDTNADGVVDVRNDNPNNVMIGANTGGRQTIVTMSRAVTPSDKAGRPLGTTVTASSSFGALYKFNYAQIGIAPGTPGAGVEEFAGFISGESQHCTRQFLGARLTHYQEVRTNAAYNNVLTHIVLIAAWGSQGFVGTGRKVLDLTFGCSQPLNKEMFLAIGYDGPTKTLTVALYDAVTGDLIGQVGGDIRTFDNLGVPPGDPAITNEVNALALTHLGWSDFISAAAADGQTDTWSVDSLSYFNTPSESFAAAHQPPASIWQSTFDTNTDGVVNVRTDHTPIVMIGPNNGGRQDITVASLNYAINSSNKAGRSVGTPLGASGSFGALYKFNWSSYPDTLPDSSGAEESAGFISCSAKYCTRQFMIGSFIHYFDGTNYHIRFGCRWGAEGYTGTGRRFSDINFGTTKPVNREFYLLLGYEGISKNLFSGLYDATTLEQLQLVGGDIRTFQNLGVPPNDPFLQLELNALSLPHLGWTDFAGDDSEADQQFTWSVDTLTFYNYANGGWAAIGAASPFAGACCNADFTCTDGVLPEACAGTFNGTGTTCALTSCPLPACHHPFADANGDGIVDMNDFAAFQLCYSGVGHPYPPVQCHCFDRNNDSDIDQDDFASFVPCATRAGVPANPACGG